MDATPPPKGDWPALVERFDALGRAANDALAEDTARLAALVEERDALLAELARALAGPVATGATAAQVLSRSATDTSALIAQVAERTDALRQALRDLDRGARATSAYHTTAARGTVDARR